jgi:rhamnose utilization protein RhaD (predicted bifunctional aldolase and dehydrogenase)/NAD(P)-dependent dehydrogenase (short-subunit alcohol dehydrogenase family)
MKSLWNDAEAARFAGDLGQCVYASRLLGQDPTLVMHGGGNTSVKITETDLFGEPEDVLYVKGSGWDLETIEAQGFAPVRMERVLKMAQLDRLSDTEMAHELKASMTNPSAPSPSVETILHAILPQKFVYHTHADAIIAITNTPSGADRIRELFAERCVFIPYVMPGFRLAQYCAQEYPKLAGPQTVGMILHKHGIFTMDDSSQVAYERMIELVSMAEDYLKSQNAWQISFPDVPAPSAPLRHDIAALRHALSRTAGFPVILSTHSDAEGLSFARRDDVEIISQQGPATPDHVIRTKRLPMIGRDVPEYAAAYAREFERHAPEVEADLTMLDPAPRVILDPELGLCTVGGTVKAASIAEDIYRHTIKIILQATALDSYEALPPFDLFEMEYWELEQAKLRRGGKPPMFTGEVALVTGAASGIGKACAQSLLTRGAAVTGLDINPEISGTFNRKDFLGIPCDVTDEDALLGALETTVRRYGGLDMLVLNAGIFPSSTAIGDMALDQWRRVMTINLDANMVLMREALPLLKQAPNGGRVVIVGSKNVPAPGPGAAAYSTSKAALNQLARVAALEWGSSNIRINSVHPNAVFDTGLWTDELLQTRAAHYGLTVDEYKTNNVLRVPVTSAAVGEMVAELCGPVFKCTTGAQIPIDGGNERVI